jgi:hypothetical protein
MWKDKEMNASCVICGTHLADAMPTDNADVRVCFTCNLPYKVVSSGVAEIDLDMDSLAIARTMFKYYKKKGIVANVCPGAMTLSNSPRNRTSEQDWARWMEFFKANPQLFNDSEMYKD